MLSPIFAYISLPPLLSTFNIILLCDHWLNLPFSAQNSFYSLFSSPSIYVYELLLLYIIHHSHNTLRVNTAWNSSCTQIFISRKFIKLKESSHQNYMINLRLRWVYTLRNESLSDLFTATYHYKSKVRFNNL